MAATAPGFQCTKRLLTKFGQVALWATSTSDVIASDGSGSAEE
jgi:hypothetical protein